jgi:integrase
VKKNWREQMRREWEQLTTQRIARRAPRHSSDEIRQIFAALEHPDVDPRIALAIELGAEARLGQVRRLRRKDVDLSPVGAFGLGRVTVHGAGKKLGVTRDLTPEERGAIDRALGGYLKHLEDAYTSGLRSDYPMFPAGRLQYDTPPSRIPKKRRAGEEMAVVRRAAAAASDAPLEKRSLTDMFHDLERAAGIEPVEGRGWYGIRRRAADVYEDYETDERVLNDQTGHRHSDTRREIYQERDREAIRARSAHTRRRVRAAVFGRRNEPAEEANREAESASRTDATGSNDALLTPRQTPAPHTTVNVRGRNGRKRVVDN